MQIGMISCLALERPGVWRGIGVVILCVVLVLPTAPVLWQMADAPNNAESVGAAFSSALQNSTVVALLVAVGSLGVGLPIGVFTALYEFPVRRVLTGLLILPLLLPSFLWAIAWASLAARLGAPAITLLSGVTGCVFVFFAQAAPLVFLATQAAILSISEAQLDAARVAGGERVVLAAVGRSVTLPALLAAGLGGVLTLSDSGPAQIFGLRTAASEILTSFASLYDVALAGRQCVSLAMLVLLAAAPLAFFAAPRLANELLVRQVRPARRVHNPVLAGVIVVLLGFLVVSGTFMPLIGLALSVNNGDALLRAWREFSHTALNTLLYAAGAGTVAVVFGFLLAGCIGRSDQLRIVVLSVMLALFSLPSALAALGIAQLATEAPAWADSFLRSRFTVCVALGLRFSPVAVVLALRAWGTTSPTWVSAAEVHGVPFSLYVWRVLFPLLRPAVITAGLLVALLATTDVSTILLLHPPGERSLPLAIFTVMANAPEAVVASLCLVYLGIVVVFIAGWALVGRPQI